MRISYKIILFLFISSFTLFPQEKKPEYQIDFNEIKGELTNNDLYRKEFGRYDGYQIELYEGEAVHFIASSENFQPSLALVNSNGEIIIQSVRNDKGYAEIITSVTVSSNCVLYLIGEEKARGKYLLQTAIAEPSSLTISDQADFCRQLDFLLAHSIAYFSFIENPAVSKQHLVKISGAVDVFIDEEDGSYKSVFYSGNSLGEAESFMKKISDEVKECLGDGWKLRRTSWEKRTSSKERSVLFEENKTDRVRLVEIIIADFTGSLQNDEKRYSVTLKINRK